MKKILTYTIAALLYAMTAILILGSDQAKAQRCDGEVETGFRAFFRSGDGVGLGFGIRVRDRDDCDDWDRDDCDDWDRDHWDDDEWCDDRDRWDRDDWRDRDRWGSFLPRHPISFANCPVYGRVEREWDDGEEWAGIDLSDTDPGCAEASYEETVRSYSYELGPPMDVSHQRRFGGLERSSSWYVQGRVLTVEYNHNWEERGIEVFTEFEDECPW